MTKINIIQKLVEFTKTQIRQNSKILTIFSALFGTILSGVAGFQVIQKIDDTKPTIAYAAGIDGGSPLGGANTIKLDKVYSNAAGSIVDAENISATGGDEITVRLKYNNTGSLAATNAQVKDSLPAGFQYVSGSTLNCTTPTAVPADKICDTFTPTQKDTFGTRLFGAGISPIAGLKQTGLDDQGFLEIGKKRYIQIDNRWEGGGKGFSIVPCNLKADNNPIFVDFGNNCFGRPQLLDGSATKTDTLNTRYLQIKVGSQFGYNDGVSCGFASDNIPAYQDPIGVCYGRQFNYDFSKIDLLGHRFIQYQLDWNPLFSIYNALSCK